MKKNKRKSNNKFQKTFVHCASGKRESEIKKLRLFLILISNAQAEAIFCFILLKIISEVEVFFVYHTVFVIIFLTILPRFLSGNIFDRKLLLLS